MRNSNGYDQPSDEFKPKMPSNRHSAKNKQQKKSSGKKHQKYINPDKLFTPDDYQPLVDTFDADFNRGGYELEDSFGSSSTDDDWMQGVVRSRSSYDNRVSEFGELIEQNEYQDAYGNEYYSDGPTGFYEEEEYFQDDYEESDPVVWPAPGSDVYDTSAADISSSEDQSASSTGKIPVQRTTSGDPRRKSIRQRSATPEPAADIASDEPIFGSQMPEGVQTGAAAYSRNRYRSASGSESTDTTSPKGAPVVGGQNIAAGYDSGGYKASSKHGSGSKGKRHRRTKYKKKLRRRRTIIIAVVAAVLIIGGCGTAFGLTAMSAKSNASTLLNQATILKADLTKGDMQSARQTAQQLTTTSQKLKDDTNSPIWGLACILPGVGGDLSQVRTVANVANTLCDQVLGPVVDALPEEGLSQIMLPDSTVNIQAIQAVLAPLGENAGAIADCQAQIDKMGETKMDALKDPIDQVRSLVGGLNQVAEVSGDLQTTLPAMLGANGERRYLVLACSEAELRSIGGFPGSAGIMTFNNGKMEVGDFESPTKMMSNPSAHSENAVVLENENEIFGTRVNSYFYDALFVPDLPRAAEIMMDTWKQNGNRNIDGIICMSPVVLQSLLALTGGIVASDGTIVDGTNAAEQLSNTTYIRFPDDNAAQDAFFADVASKALNKVLGNLSSIDTIRLIDVLSNSIADNRIYVWMSNTQEESVIQQLGWAGALSQDEEEPVAGVYLGAGTGCKIYWYMGLETNVGSARRNSDGSSSYEVTLSFRNNLTQALISSLSKYILGSDPYATTSGEMFLDIWLSAPAGGTISNIQTSGTFLGKDYDTHGWCPILSDEDFTESSYQGIQMQYGIAQIPPDSTTRVTYTVTTSPNAEAPLTLDVTPLPVSL